MKKGFKVLSSLLIALLMLVNVVPFANAQDSDPTAVLDQINQANQEVTSMSGDGFIGISMSNQGQNADLGQVNFDFAYNVDPRFSMEANAEVVSPFIGQSLGADFFIQEGVAYIFDGTAWTAQDFSAEEQEISDAFYEAMNQATQAQDSETAQGMTELNAKYTDMEETDTEYIFTLKQDINAQEFWDDMNALVDLEAIKNEAIAQSEAETGEPLPAEAVETIDQMYSVETIEAVLSTNPVFTASYDKESLRLTHLSFELTINPNDFMPAEATTESVEGTEGTDMASQMPESITVTGEMNFTGFGEQFEIAVPQEAIDALVPTETEEPVESIEDPATDSVEDTSSEAVEETTEEATEETSEEATEETTEETVEESVEESVE